MEKLTFDTCKKQVSSPIFPSNRLLVRDYDLLTREYFDNFLNRPYNGIKTLVWDSQNFLRKFVRFFVTLDLKILKLFRL